MLVSIRNPRKNPRIIYGLNGQQIQIPPGETVENVQIAEGLYKILKLRDNDLEFLEPTSLANWVDTPVVDPITGIAKPRLSVTGMFGIGDNIHQRAIVKELMKGHEVYLDTYNVAPFHDLIKLGLRVMRRGTPRMKEGSSTAALRSSNPDRGPKKSVRICYEQRAIKEHGSILKAMFNSVGLEMPDKPDFAMPVPKQWKDNLANKLKGATIDKPIMVYRPIILNKVWERPNRSPDPQAYAELYQHIRSRYFVISIANLQSGREWIVGPEQDVDLKLHAGELDFEEMAALFSTASLVFCNAGFAPVLAQSVGTPTICVYGGNESSKTTNCVGTHLAPTCFIEPIEPCDCHSYSHPCKKEIDIAQARLKIDEFLAEQAMPKTLIFGTSYINSDDRAELLGYWQVLNETINPTCDRLLVDTPAKASRSWTTNLRGTKLIGFNDDLGHLSRGGRDGWGRAFTTGLQYAIDEGYEYVAHIEADLLFKPKIEDIVRKMRNEKIMVMCVPAIGTKYKEPHWIETGCIIFNVEYIKSSDLIAKYAWEKRRMMPPPEADMKRLVKDHLYVANWNGQRNDRNELIISEAAKLDFITHCKDIEFYRAFIKFGTVSEPAAPREIIKLNFGCGTNKLEGWKNSDSEIDIKADLPFDSEHANFILAEHVVEHVDYYSALRFFEQCFRVLKPGGVLRVAVPSIEQIYLSTDQDYFKFTTKWQPDPTKRGAMHAILHAHGHKTAWTASLLEASLFYAGFECLRQCLPGQSSHPDLMNVEGHHKVIGDKFNKIETLIFEGMKPPNAGVANEEQLGVAIVVGGSSNWKEELEEAENLCKGAGVNYHYFIVNSHIETWNRGNFTACTLHVEKIDNWLIARARNNLPALSEIASYRSNKQVTHVYRDWKGSCGLFAFIVARERGYNRVLFTGVPMSPEKGHYRNTGRWIECEVFKPGWLNHKNEITPYARSLSGWSAELIGKPDLEFLTKVKQLQAAE